MKIAVVCPYDMDRPGGVQGHIVDTARAMRTLGHDVTIIGPTLSQGPLPDALEGVPIRRFGRGRNIPFSGTRFEIAMARGEEYDALRHFLREEAFEVIHYHTIWTPWLPLQIFGLSTSANVVTFHDTPANDLGGRIWRFIFSVWSWFLLRRMDGAIAVSQSPRAHLHPPADLPVHIVPPCTDLTCFTGSPLKPAIPESPVDILFLGRLEKRKGAIILLQAFRLLKERRAHVRLIIAGKGEEETSLRRYAIEHGLSDVSFIGGFAKNETPSLYAGCDIFCAPSPYGESFGIVLAEAMASGRPVVAADNSGYRTLLTGKGADLLVPPDDAAALADKLERLVRDAGLRRDLSEWGRTHALNYDARAIAPRILDIYADAMERKAAKAQNGI